MKHNKIIPDTDQCFDTRQKKDFKFEEGKDGKVIKKEGGRSEEKKSKEGRQR